MSSPIPNLNLLFCIPPILSFIYTLSILIFLASWRECSWTAMTSPLLSRFAIATIVTSLLLSPSPLPTPMVIFIGALSTNTSLYLIIRSRTLYIQGPKPPPKNMSGRVIMITGANAGIGRETARQLLSRGATIIMACRSEGRACEAMSDIISSSSENATALKKRLIFLPMDLSSFASVRRSVDLFQKMNLPLHVLINNAGVMMGTKTVTGDGHEMMMQCNHLGHFLLTNLLLPKLRAPSQSSAVGPTPSHPCGRVINVTSCTYNLASKGFDTEDLMAERRGYTLFGQYAQSKLANILMARELGRREEGKVDCYSVHPGLVRTDVVRNMPWYLKLGNDAFGFILQLLQKTPEAGAYTSVYCACSDDVMGSNGRYYVNSEERSLLDFARDDEVAKRLWALSENLVGLKSG